MTGRRTRRGGDHVAVIAVTFVLLAVATPTGHDVPNEVLVQAFVKPDGNQVNMVVRLPLILLANVDLPKRGPGYLALRHMEPALQAAVQATGAQIALYEGEDRLRLASSGARISLPSSKTFAIYEEAVADIAGPMVNPTANIFWNQGFFDAHLRYPINSDQSEFAINVGLAPGLGDSLRTSVRFVTQDGSTRPYELVGQVGLIHLDPRWHQAAWTFVGSGLTHILNGIDHLLFLVCLIVPFRRFRGLLLVVTSFTIAHSITLIAAAYGLAPTGEWFPPLVEALIAASIVYMALENVVAANLKRRWVITFAFGLVHGFGFAFALQETLQFAGSHLVVSLLAFNVGVELGQILVLALCVPALVILFRYAVAEYVGTLIISVLVGHTAWHWMIDRGAALSIVEWPNPVSIFPPILISGLILTALIGGLLWYVTRHFSFSRLLPSTDTVPVAGSSHVNRGVNR